jgi:ATP-dependent helicase/nuclease subunit B
VTETKPQDDANLVMSAIAKDHSEPGLRAFTHGADHPAMALWSSEETGLVHRIHQWIQRRNAHAAKTLVLLPYAQLLPLARRAWATAFPVGFAPRFETTANWLAAGSSFRIQSTDISHDMALDSLTAQQLLNRSGLGAHASLAGLLAETAHELAPWAAAVQPQYRKAWAHKARQVLDVGLEGEALAWESHIVRVAVEWAAVSSFETDVLFDAEVFNAWESVALVQGASGEPIYPALAGHWGEKARLFQWSEATPACASWSEASSKIRFYACADVEDEAQRAAACALAHIAEDRYPVALVSSDRALTRRVRAMLDEAGVSIRDENGWKLSTSRAGASLMALLRCCVWNANTDAVLNAFNAAPAFSSDLYRVEQALRSAQVREWRRALVCDAVAEEPTLAAVCALVEGIRASLSGRHTFTDWLTRLRAALQACDMWQAMQLDAAGLEILTALRLMPADPSSWSEYASTALWAGERLDLASFTSWVNLVLEAQSFKPPLPPQEQVVILPMTQMLARPFAAVVLAGCDEVRLNPSPEPAGLWTPAQRLGLGMPSRTELEARLRASWCHALQAPVCDVLWRTSDERGEKIAASPLVEWLQSRYRAAHGNDECPAQEPSEVRTARLVPRSPTQPPLPRGDRLPVSHLSASAYETLRSCPYRFFALRQLGLMAVEELEVDLDKRDFGVWLHAVLEKFHSKLAACPIDDIEERSVCLQETADEVTASMSLPEGEFLPFASSWPALREGYLRWLATHESQGWTFASGETPQRQPAGSAMLVGRIDRTDSGPDGQWMLLDYKTEALQKTKDRVKEPFEDTQVAFYAALAPKGSVRAGYVNLSESGTSFIEQPRVEQAREALLIGVQHDLERLAAGAPLPALGDGAACEFCDARGLCRKDFWVDT